MTEYFVIQGQNSQYLSALRKKEGNKNNHYSTWAPSFIYAKWCLYVCVYVTTGQTHILQCSKECFIFPSSYFEVSLQNCLQGD